MIGTIASLDLNPNVMTKRLGKGVEIKNEITFGGSLPVMHAIGIAQQAAPTGRATTGKAYYRVRTELPY